MAYSAKTWALVKVDYESGDYSVDKLHQKHTISREAIITRMVREKWEKGKNAAIIEKTIAEKNIALFAKLGMTQEVLAKKLIEGVNIPEATTTKLVEMLKDDDMDMDFITKVVPQLVDDRKLALEYMKEIIKLFGTHAPIKREDNIKNLNPSMTFNIDAKNIQGKTAIDVGKCYSDILRSTKKG